MSTIKAVIRNGQVEVDSPIDMPDGTEITIQLPDKHALRSTLGDDAPMTSEEITRILSLMDLVRPFEMTDAERAAWEADRRTRREVEKDLRQLHRSEQR